MSARLTKPRKLPKNPPTELDGKPKNPPTESVGKPKRPRRRHDVVWLTCVHEAGHAVVLVEQGAGGSIRYVTVTTDPVAGECRPKGAPGGYGSLDYVAFCLGGLEAERVLSRRRFEEIAKEHAKDDMDEARRSAEDRLREGHSGTGLDAKVKAFTEEGRRAARKIVRRHWEAVLAVAEALLSNGDLGAEDVVQIALSADPELADIVRTKAEADERWFRKLNQSDAAQEVERSESSEAAPAMPVVVASINASRRPPRPSRRR